MLTAENALYLTIGAVNAARNFVATRMNPFGCGYAAGGTARVYTGERIELHDHDMRDPHSREILHGTPEVPIARYMNPSGRSFTKEPYSKELHGERIDWVNEGEPVPSATNFTHKHGIGNSIGPWEV